MVGRHVYNTCNAVLHSKRPPTGEESGLQAADMVQLSQKQVWKVRTWLFA